MTLARKIQIKNKKASFEYFFEAEFEAGIQLTGTEVKSLREGPRGILPDPSIVGSIQTPGFEG